MNLWLILFLSSIVLFIFILRKTFDKKWKKYILSILLFILILFSLFRIVFPLKPALEPRGPSKVQYGIYYYKHITKFPEMATKGEEREIPVHLWAPEELKQQAHPALIFSHGSFGVGLSNETLFKELASRGYIVMSVDHPHHSFSTKLSDGTNIMVNRDFIQSVMSQQGNEDLQDTLNKFNEWLDIRLEDINFVVNQLTDTQKNSKFEESIDLNRVVLSGHSLGGSAALAIGREHADKFKAMVILEAPFMKDIIGIEGDKYVFTEEDYPLPLLHIYSDALYGKTDNITTYEMNEGLIQSENPKYVNAHISGVGHLGLTDMLLVSPILTNIVDGNLNTRKAPETLLEINEVVIEFLEEFNN